MEQLVDRLMHEASQHLSVIEWHDLSLRDRMRQKWIEIAQKSLNNPS